MDSVAVGFWGAYFGTVSLMLAAALIAFQRSAQRVALTGAVSALMSGLYVLVFLGWWPAVEPQAALRLQAHVACVSAAGLGLLFFSMLGLLRDRVRAVRRIGTMALLAAGTIAGGWWMPPEGALALAVAMQGLVIALSYVFALRSALRGARLSWLALAGVGFMLVMVAGLTWHALNPRATPWPVHAAAAVSGMAYVAIMGSALWVRYSWLIDLREVMTHGPSFDPITRMRSHAETGLLLGETFARRDGDQRPIGVVVVSIANLYALEQLHGRSAYNHALFMCASRLRRCVPPHVEMGRLSEDGFLLLVRDPSSTRALIQLSQRVARQLAKPVVLGTSGELSQLETRRTQWVASAGVGVLVAPAHLRPAQAVSLGRAMSRTALSYESRVAWYDPAAEQIAELPLPPQAPSRAPIMTGF